MTRIDIPVQCTRCRHQCMESEWHDKPVKVTGSIGMFEKVCPKCNCKSYFDMSPQVAWCWASGLIETGDAMPENNADGSGAIFIAKGPKSFLRGVLEVAARNSHQSQLLVPGVPEAPNPDAAIDAFKAWHAWCAKGNGRKHRHGVEFVKVAS